MPNVKNDPYVALILLETIAYQDTGPIQVILIILVSKLIYSMVGSCNPPKLHNYQTLK